MIVTKHKKTEHEVPHAFNAGDSVQLLSFEKLPSHYLDPEFHLGGIQTNHQKMAYLGKPCTIAEYFFYGQIEGWVYRLEEDDQRWAWLEDMFLLEQVVLKEKAQNNPQMPFI